MIRCFLAVELPQEIKEILAELQQRLRPAGAGVRWVRPEGFHLTLKFFGNMPEKNLPSLVRAAKEVSRGYSPFELVLSGLGFFPEKGPPRVIWVGLSGGLEPLLALQRDLERAFEALGFPREKKGFHPHLTLGRIKEGRRARELQRCAEELEVPTGRFQVKTLTFYRSVLHPQGAIYSSLYRVDLE